MLKHADKSVRKSTFYFLAIFFSLALFTANIGSAQYYDGYYIDSGATSGATLFSEEELNDLLAPIALYPDPLLAQILPAATFIDQIGEAASYVREYGQTARIDVQPWDVSVKAVAHYPDVLFMMEREYDWTVALGQAFINQPQDVMDAIQRLRTEAAAAGNLVSTPEQQVIYEEGIIRIVPAAPEVIYVPDYDPTVVYYEQPTPAYGFITFGIGYTIGAWLNRDCDWRRHHIYYHGWRGSGWIGRARPYIHSRDNIYVNNKYNVIATDRRVMRHNINRYREKIHHDVQIMEERAGRPALPTGAIPSRPAEIRKQPERGIRQAPAPRVEQPTTVAPVTRPATKPEKKEVYRGRDVKKIPPASRSGYGGSGAGGEAPAARESGRSNRQETPQIRRPAQIQRIAPTQPPSPVRRAAPVQRAIPAPSVPTVTRPTPSPHPVPAQRPALTPLPAPAQRPAVTPHPAPVQRPVISDDRQPASTPAVQPAPRQTAPVQLDGRGQRLR